MKAQAVVNKYSTLSIILPWMNLIWNSNNKDKYLQPKTEAFTFPDLFANKAEQKEKDEKSMDDSKNGFRKFLDRNKKRPGTPGWYSI